MLYPDELRALERMLMLTKKVMHAHRFFLPVASPGRANV